MKVYISGPVTGTEDYLRRFRKAEEELTAAGHTVINPAKVNSNMPEGTTHEEYMAMSFTMLEMCNAIYLLNGWKLSKGATMEFDRAVDRKMNITFEEGWTCAKECQSRQKLENLARGQEKRSFTEIVEPVFSAR